MKKMSLIVGLFLLVGILSACEMTDSTASTTASTSNTTVSTSNTTVSTSNTTVSTTESTTSSTVDTVLPVAERFWNAYNAFYDGFENGQAFTASADGSLVLHSQGTIESTIDYYAMDVEIDWAVGYYHAKKTELDREWFYTMDGESLYKHDILSDWDATPRKTVRYPAEDPVSVFGFEMARQWTGRFDLPKTAGVSQPASGVFRVTFPLSFTEDNESFWFWYNWMRLDRLIGGDYIGPFALAEMTFAFSEDGSSMDFQFAFRRENSRTLGEYGDYSLQGSVRRAEELEPIDPLSAFELAALPDRQALVTDFHQPGELVSGYVPTGAFGWMAFELEEGRYRTDVRFDWVTAESWIVDPSGIESPLPEQIEVTEAGTYYLFWDCPVSHYIQFTVGFIEIESATGSTIEGTADGSGIPRYLSFPELEGKGYLVFSLLLHDGFLGTPTEPVSLVMWNNQHLLESASLIEGGEIQTVYFPLDDPASFVLKIDGSYVGDYVISFHHVRGTPGETVLSEMPEITQNSLDDPFDLGDEYPTKYVRFTVTEAGKYRLSYSFLNAHSTGFSVTLHLEDGMVLKEHWTSSFPLDSGVYYVELRGSSELLLLDLKIVKG